MTKKMDESQLIKDFEKGKLYAEMALEHKCHVSTVEYRLKKLGFMRRKQGTREVFSQEDKQIVSELLDTDQGRKQLLNILKKD